MQSLVLLDGQFRTLQFDIDAIAISDAFAQIECLLELITGVQVENRSLGGNLGQHVNDRHALRTKSGRHRETRRESGHGPAKDFLGRGGLEFVAPATQFVQEFLARL
jgi:hypothetical protein